MFLVLLSLLSSVDARSIGVRNTASQQVARQQPAHRFDHYQMMLPKKRAEDVVMIDSGFLPYRQAVTSEGRKQGHRDERKRQSSGSQRDVDLSFTADEFFKFHFFLP